MKCLAKNSDMVFLSEFWYQNKAQDEGDLYLHVWYISLTLIINLQKVKKKKKLDSLFFLVSI